jgi:hypothetical protein
MASVAARVATARANKRIPVADGDEYHAVVGKVGESTENGGLLRHEAMSHVCWSPWSDIGGDECERVRTPDHRLECRWTRRFHKAARKLVNNRLQTPRAVFRGGKGHSNLADKSALHPQPTSAVGVIRRLRFNANRCRRSKNQIFTCRGKSSSARPFRRSACCIRRADRHTCKVHPRRCCHRGTSG